MSRVPVAVAIAAAALLLPMSAHAQPPTGDFVGVVAEDVFAGDPAYREQQLAQMQSIGIGAIRQTFRWRDIERSPGSYDLSVYDAFVADAARHGITIIPVLFDPPPFRALKGRKRGTYPPRHYGDLGDFGAVVARRYGPQGTLWSERPNLPPHPVRAYQVWNEPNLPVYWPTGPSPEKYARLLRATAKPIEQVDPGAEILTAGLPESKLAPIPLIRFTKRMYRAGAKRGFDTLAINPYARSARGLMTRVRRARRVMRAFRDRGARIRVTELGWATQGPPSPFRAGPRGQARLIRRSIRMLDRHGRRLGVRGVVYFNWRDLPPYAGGRNFWGLHTGLKDRNGQPKPGFAALAQAIDAL
jgi:hypothetical protein